MTELHCSLSLSISFSSCLPVDAGDCLSVGNTRSLQLLHLLHLQTTTRKEATLFRAFFIPPSFDAPSSTLHSPHPQSITGIHRHFSISRRLSSTSDVTPSFDLRPLFFVVPHPSGHYFLSPSAYYPGSPEAGFFTIRTLPHLTGFLNHLGLTRSPPISTFNMAFTPGVASRFAVLVFFTTSTCVFLALFFFPTIYADDSWDTYIPKAIRPSQSRCVSSRPGSQPSLYKPLTWKQTCIK